MDSFEWNKILGAILGTLLFVFIVNEVASIVFHGEEPEEMAYKIDIPEEGAAVEGEQEPEVVDFGTLLQQASAESGEAVAKRCLQCHSFEKGGPNKTGPNLWGVLGRDIAASPGFRYSNALSQLEGDWTYEKIYDFVAAPSRYVRGTSMNFAGLRRKKERINLLAYLRTQSDTPPPIPEPLPEEASGEGSEAPAGEEAGDDGAVPADVPAGNGGATANGAGEEPGTPATEDSGAVDDQAKPDGATGEEERAGEDAASDEDGGPESDTSTGGAPEDGNQ